MKFPDKPITLDDTSGFTSGQQKIINSVVTNLYREFTGKIMGQVEESEPIIQKLTVNASAIMTNLIDRVYCNEAFLSFTLHSTSSSMSLFQVNDKYTIKNIRWTGIASDEESYYTLNNYASINVVSYNNHNYVLLQINSPLPANTWNCTFSIDIDDGNNYDSATIKENNIEYYVSSYKDKNEQARLNSSLDSIRQLIYTYEPETTKENFYKIETENTSTISIDKEPSSTVYLVGNYNGVPIRLGSLLRSQTNTGILKINVSDPNIYEYNWTITNSTSKYTTGTFTRNSVSAGNISSLLANYGITFTMKSGTYDIQYSVILDSTFTEGDYTYYNYTIKLQAYKVKEEIEVTDYKIIQLYR